MKYSVKFRDYIDLNVVILPNKELSLKLIQWSSFIASQFETDYVLDRSTRLPHLSLYSARYPLKNKAFVDNSVKTIVSSTARFNITMEGFLFSQVFFSIMRKKIKIC